jgi:amino acid transporter
MAAIAFFFKGPKSSKEDLSLQQRFKLLDLWGTLVFMPAIVCLLLALQWGGSKYAWKSAQVIVLLVVFFVLICAFIVIQLWKQENATLPPRILRQRSVASGAWYASCTGAALLLAVFYVGRFQIAYMTGPLLTLIDCSSPSGFKPSRGSPPRSPVS